MAGLTNFRPYTEQDVEVGFVIVTEDSSGGMVDIHDRRRVVLEPKDACRWMDLDTPVEEAAHIAQSPSLPTEEFMWWRVDRAVNRADPYNNRKEFLAPITEPTLNHENHILENLDFSALHLTRDASTRGALVFDWEPIEAICEANASDIALFSRDKESLSRLLMEWYIKHRKLGGAPDPVMEDLIEEARIAVRLGSGVSHTLGNA